MHQTAIRMPNARLGIYLGHAYLKKNTPYAAGIGAFEGRIAQR